MTADGSPSLRDLQSPTQEMMHHRGGALSESRYIYEPVIREALEWALEKGIPSNHKIRVVSLGLGLGYNEILCFMAEVQGYGQRTNGTGENLFEVYSYEKDPRLREEFQSWIEGRPSVYTDLYESILAALRAGLPPGMPSIDVRGRLQEALSQGRLHLMPALIDSDQLPGGIHVYLWDAFSRSTSPELWDEDFLKACLAKSDARWSRLSTYAQVGPLKRALKAQGFTLHERPGFQGKRQSTLASRGF